MGMKNRFQEAIQNVQRQRHLARRSVAMVLVLAMLTAMSVSWRLHQDGIALASNRWLTASIWENSFGILGSSPYNNFRMC